jgi:hypothetical protein
VGGHERAGIRNPTVTDRRLAVSGGGVMLNGKLEATNGTGGLGRKRDSYGVLASRTDP